MTASNVGRWNAWYRGVTAPEPYAQTPTYKMGADWLADCALIEDWGCGKGWLSTLVPAEQYRGIDGSRTPFAAEVADLAAYRSSVPGVFMRHVLEHDHRWARILDNALASFTERMALILFTPPAEVTHDIEWEDPPGVPNLAFRPADITDRIDAAGASWTERTIKSASKYGTESVYMIRRDA